MGVVVPRDAEAAVAWYRRAAEQGYAPAQCALGICLRFGMGVGRNDAEAAKWLRAAASQGHALAQCALADCCMKGEGEPKDEKETMRLYRAAAEQGLAAAQNSMGYYLSSGLLAEKNSKAAVLWYLRAAEQGNLHAQNGLGWLFLNGDGVAEDHVRAVSWFRKAADEGDCRALTNMGWCSENGYGMVPEPGDMADWYRAAAEQGFANAQKQLGECYEDGYGVPENMAVAVKWYRLAAEQGHVDAQRRLGDIYAEGRPGVEENQQEATKWYAKMTEADMASGMVEYGLRLLEGTGIAENKEEAARLFERASKSENLHDSRRGFNHLGECYENGWGVEKNTDRAMECYRHALQGGIEAGEGRYEAFMNLARCAYFGIGQERDAEQAASLWALSLEERDWVSDYGRSYNELGVCYELGEGVPKDLHRAASLYEEGANAGNRLASYNLARCYELGLGVERQPEKAVEHYQKAAAGRIRRAYDALVRFKVSFNPVFVNGKYMGSATPVAQPQKIDPDVPEMENPQPLRAFDMKPEEYLDVDALYAPQREMYIGLPDPDEGAPQEKNTEASIEELLREGEGYEKEGDMDSAVDCYMDAAELWSSAAYMRLALCAYTGAGLPREREEAWKWLRKAVNQGVFTALILKECLEMLEAGEAAGE